MPPADDHLAVVPRCAACADAIHRREMITALYEDGDGTVRRTCEFPHLSLPEYITNIDDFQLCCRPRCSRCARSPEFVSLHVDCSAIFARSCGRLPPAAQRAYLWTVGAHRSPWRGALPVDAAPRRTFDPAALRTVAGMCGLGRLASMPPEIVLAIYEADPELLFWRAVAVVHLAGRLSASPPADGPRVSLLLPDVVSWDRGTAPVVTTSEPGASAESGTVLRMTVDLHGLRKIERLAAWPQFTSQGKSRSSAYIVNYESYFADTQLVVKDGRARLQFPSNTAPSDAAPSNTEGPDAARRELRRRNGPSRPEFELHVWNVPCPPKVDSCVLCPEPNGSRRHWVADLSGASGVTFFYRNRLLKNVHVHDRANPSALAARHRPSGRGRKGTLWIYLPIPDNDAVLALGAAKSTFGYSILVRTRLAGDFVLGPPRNNSQNDRFLGTGSPLTLIHAETLIPNDDGGSYFGTYQPDPVGRPPPFTAPSPTPAPRRIPETYFSSAPLEAVVSARVFVDAETGLALGILFRYENGAARAVGECRVQVDASEEFCQPSCLYLQRRASTVTDRAKEAARPRVVFGCEGRHEHPVEGERPCKPLRGVLQVWSSPYSVTMSVVGTDAT